VGSAVLLLVRSGEISALNQACPGGQCRAGSNRDDLESTRSRALVEGPVAVALGVAGALSAGAGAYLVLTTQGGSSNSASGTHVLPLFDLGTAGIAVTGRFDDPL
jgi:hypothetical protein